MIDVDEHEVPVSRAALSPGGAVFQAWVDACEAGVDPAFVTSQTARDDSALAARGIRRLIRPDLSTSGVDPYGSVNTVVSG